MNPQRDAQHDAKMKQIWWQAAAGVSHRTGCNSGASYLPMCHPPPTWAVQHDCRMPNGGRRDCAMLDPSLMVMENSTHLRSPLLTSTLYRLLPCEAMHGIFPTGPGALGKTSRLPTGNGAQWQSIGVEEWWQSGSKAHLGSYACSPKPSCCCDFAAPHGRCGMLRIGCMYVASGRSRILAAGDEAQRPAATAICPKRTVVGIKSSIRQGNYLVACSFVKTWAAIAAGSPAEYVSHAMWIESCT
jgi:hypothetical protein